MSAVIHKIEHEFFVNAFRLVDYEEGSDFESQYYKLWHYRVNEERIDFRQFHGFVTEGRPTNYWEVLRELKAFFDDDDFDEESVQTLKHLRALAGRIVEERQDDIDEHRSRNAVRKHHIDAIKLWKRLENALNDKIDEF